MLKQILEGVGQKIELKYFHCGKDGYVPQKLESAAREIKIRLTNKRACYQPYAPEPPLN